MITKEDIKKAERLVGEDGFFKSQYPGNIETHEYSIGFLEELCEYCACLPSPISGLIDLHDEERLETVLGLEKLIQKALNGEFSDRPMVKGGINYIPTWSTKMKK